jgi:chlorite dismutase
MSHPIIPPLALHGWYMLTQFLDVAPPVDGEAAGERRGRLHELSAHLAEREDLGEGGWSGLYRLVGGRSDYMLLHLRPSLEALGVAERELRLSPAARDVIPVGDYLSVVELGLYAHTQALAEKAAADGVEVGSEEWDAMVEGFLAQQKDSGYARRRLYPRQPESMPYVCFYPMNKRRRVGQNWYTLPLGERARLMQEHGMTGRAYAGKVSQIISGSVGFDDWEWAVTLFAGDPLHFKELVTEMRYDEVTSVYGDFGSFWVGHRVAADDLVEEFTGA